MREAYKECLKERRAIDHNQLQAAWFLGPDHDVHVRKFVAFRCLTYASPCPTFR